MGREEPRRPSPYRARREQPFSTTLTLDIEFKKGLPKKGQECTLARTMTKIMQDGRMDLDVTLCDHNMDIICLSRQTLMVVDAERKFGTRNKEKLEASL
jgi:hypothetical protein